MVPVAVVDDHRVLPMSIIHLADMRSQLIALRPVLLCRFTMEVANTFHVCSAKEVSAGILVALNVQRGYTPSHPLYHGK